MKNKQRLFLKIGIVLTIISLPLFAYAEPAEVNKTLLKGLAEDNINKLDYPFGGPNVLRSIGWWLLKLFAGIVDSLYSGVGTVIKKMGFAGSKEVQGLVSTYHDLLLGVLIISVTCLGFWLIWKVGDRRGNIAQNIIICVLVISSFPLLTNQITKYTTAATTAVIDSGFEEAASKSSFKNATGKGSSGSKGTAISSIVVASQIVDLKMVKDKGKSKVCWRNSKTPQGYIDGGCILGKKWRNIDINTVMESEAPFDKYYDGSDYVDTPSLIASIGKGKYYRYQVLSWFELVLMMAVVAFVLFFALLKIARLIIDAAFAEIYVPFIAATDLVEGQRTKEAIKHFVSIFAAIFLCVALIGLYFVGFSWIESTFKGFLKLVMHFALAWAVIDGPDIIERIIGIDVGVKSGYQAMMGAYAAGRTVRDAGKGLKNLGTGGVKFGKAANNVMFGKKGADGMRHGGLIKLPKDADSNTDLEKGNNGLDNNSRTREHQENFDKKNNNPSKDILPNKNIGGGSYSGKTPSKKGVGLAKPSGKDDNKNLPGTPASKIGGGVKDNSVSKKMSENQKKSPIPSNNIGGATKPRSISNDSKPNMSESYKESTSRNVETPSRNKNISHTSETPAKRSPSKKATPKEKNLK